MSKDDKDDSDSIPTIVRRPLPAKLEDVEKRLQALRLKNLHMVEDASEVIHAAIVAQDYKGKKVTRTQVFAAAPILQRFAPMLENVGTGNLHLHINIPRPGKPAINKNEKEIIDVEAKPAPVIKNGS